MKANQIRQTFFDFFKSKGHKIVPSAPIVLKDDPTLMFTNAGMNQFKDLFLGYKEPKNRRIADSQKCLRVSGKHNDLEEVGIDSYHHTMFEMLGNWSIGDYFKEDAIGWAWELLTKVYGLDESRLYVTIFGGDNKDGLSEDQEAADFWKKYVPEDRILYCGKKDNFWEMGETGPCGPCSELHYDIRSDEQRAKIPGTTLVNMDDPTVIEIWNLVFIQYNRKADGSLELLPEKHIDTGMGFERLCMALQGKTSNYDTDVFMPFIRDIESWSGVTYTDKYDNSSMTDIAMRVAVDHIRAVSFAIADGELPGSTGAGYVIRRILRRSVRYNYTYLNQEEPLLYKLVSGLADSFKDVFPELSAQRAFVEKVVLEEEKSFLNTLNGGLKRLENLEVRNNIIDGRDAFELYDTYGFPIDLIRLIAEEKGHKVDEAGFEIALIEQKERARKDAKRETGDWMTIKDGKEVDFVGYDKLEVHDASITACRKIVKKGEEIYQIVLDKTPFYAEGGGQVGDQGVLIVGTENIKVFDTKKENDRIIHFTKELPSDLHAKVIASVNPTTRRLTENNHTATHLMHAALREVLGTHVQQKGSLVRDTNLRFDFSHFQKVSDEELIKIERLVNQKIRENIELEEMRSIPIQEAKDAGAMMLFGEKYGENVRMITFDPDFSRELCGGCHVPATGKIGIFKIVSEGAVAAGVRRIEAITSIQAESYVNAKMAELNEIKSLFKSPMDTVKLVHDLQEDNKKLHKEIEEIKAKSAMNIQGDLVKSALDFDGYKIVKHKISGLDTKTAKTLAYNVLGELGEGIVLFGLENDGKPQLLLAISESLTKSKGLHAGNMIRNLAKMINGGGGGQSFFATAGGKDVSGLDEALVQLEKLLI
jgi:alanyl-tRNA synthetase